MLLKTVKVSSAATHEVDLATRAARPIVRKTRAPRKRADYADDNRDKAQNVAITIDSMLPVFFGYTHRDHSGFQRRLGRSPSPKLIMLPAINNEPDMHIESWLTSIA